MEPFSWSFPTYIPYTTYHMSFTAHLAENPVSFPTPIFCEGVLTNHKLSWDDHKLSWDDLWQVVQLIR